MKTVNVRTKYKIVGSDYSGQELRLATFLSQDPILLKSYAEDKDVYAMIASMIFDTSYENCLEFYPEGTEIEIDGKKVITGYKTHKNAKGKERRSVGKTCVLAGNYGMGPAGAGSLMGKTAKEGEEILNKYFSMFKGLKSAIDKSKEILKKQGYVEDIIGRRRRLPDIFLKPYEVISMNKSLAEDSFNPIIGCKNREIKDPKVTYWENKIAQEIAKNHSNQLSTKKYDELVQAAKKDNILIQSNTGKIAQAERQCFNASIQGSAGTLTKKAMIDIFNDQELKKYDTHLILTVHDEVLVECKSFYANNVLKRLPEIMINAAQELGITAPKMKCDPYIVDRWYADEAAVSLQKEYKDFEKDGLSAPEALEKLCNDHIEFPRESIINVINGTTEDLEF